MRCFDTKTCRLCSTAKGDIMSKMLHEYVLDMQLFKKSEFGWVEKQYLQLNIKGLEGKTTHFIGEMSY